MKRVLITGANGFVGRALCEKMFASGWRVRGAVRTAKDVASLPAGVEAVQIQPVGPDTNRSSAMSGVDIVVHLVARVHVLKETSADPLTEFRKVNMAGTERLAIELALNRVRRFIYFYRCKWE